MSDLQVLFPRPEVVDVQGKAIEVRPVMLCDFERFSAAASALIGMIADESPVGIYAHGRQSGVMKEVIGACTSLSAREIDKLPMPAAIDLMVAVLRVNAGFFERALARAAVALAGAK